MKKSIGIAVLFCLLLPLFSSVVNAQVRRELKREKSGFTWYELYANGKYGAESESGVTLIPLSRGYDMVMFSDEPGYIGYFDVRKGSMRGACDIKGNEVIAPRYDNYLVFSSGDGIEYKDSEGKWRSTGYTLDANGNFIRFGAAASVGGSSHVRRELKREASGFTWYELYANGKYGAESERGEVIIPLSRGYDMIMFSNEPGHIGYFDIRKGDKRGACDINGNEVIAPIYDNYLVFSADDGLQYKDSNGNWRSTGYTLDTNGRFVRVGSSASATTTYSSKEAAARKGVQQKRTPKETTPVQP